MASLDQDWQAITADARFSDLTEQKKETVRQRFYDQKVRSDKRYLDLPESKRIEVRKRFDEVTKTKPLTFADEFKKELPKIEEAGKSIARGASKALKGYQVGKAMGEQVFEQIGPQPMKAAYGALKSISGEIEKKTEEAGNILEPSEENLGRVAKKFQEAPVATSLEALQPSMTQFDLARAIGSGAVRTFGKFASSMIPKNPIDVGEYLVADGVFRLAGKIPLLGSADILAPFKSKAPKVAADTVGNLFEKSILKRQVELQARNSTTPKPLEVTAAETGKADAQNEWTTYQKWLEDHDKLSPSGGEPKEDLYPDMKNNVSQLRDAAKARLDKLRSEPIRVESLGQAEDSLRGYFRNKASMFPKPQEPIALPEASIPIEPTPLLESGKPAGLLPGKGETSTALPVKNPVEGRPRPFLKPQPTESSLPVQQGISPAISERQSSAFRPLREAYSSITAHPDYIKLKNEASDMVNRYASEKGVEPTPKFSDSLFHEIHDALGDFRTAAAKKDSAGMKVVMDKYPNIARDWDIILKMLYTETQGGTFFDSHVIGSYGAESPKSTFSSGLEGYKEFVSQSFENRLPNETKQTIDHLTGALMKSLEDENWIAITKPRQVDQPWMENVGKVIDHSLADYQEPSSKSFKVMEKMREDAGLPPSPLGDNKQRGLFEIIDELGQHFLNERGEIGGKPIDPVAHARLEANINELVDRAMSLGYTTSQDIMLWAAKNAPREIADAVRAHLSPTLSSFDTHAYQEMDQAKQGNPIARKSLEDRSIREYLTDKFEASKLGKWAKKVSANQQVLQFKDGDEALMQLKNEYFIHDSYRGHSKYELAAQRWLNEGKAPNINALSNLVGREESEKMLDAYHNPTERMKRAKVGTQDHEDNWYDLFSNFYDEMGYVDNHVTRRWKQPKEYMNWEGYVLQNKPNFTKGRKLLTQADGINAGMTPESLDIRDDIRASNNFRVGLLSKIHTLQKIGMSLTQEGLPAIIDESAAETQAVRAKIAIQKGQAPMTWLRYRNVPLLQDLAIHPDYKLAVDFMNSRRFTGNMARMMDWLSASSKGSILGLSGFHPLSLTEMLLSGGSFRDVFTFNMNRNIVAKTMRTIAKGASESLENPLTWKAPTSREAIQENIRNIGKLYDSFMKGSAALANKPLALDMAERGFHFGPINDETNNMVGRNLQRIEDFLKTRFGDARIPETAKNAVNKVRSLYDIHSKALWSYMHEAFSMSIYERQLADNIRKFNLEAPEGQKIPIDQLKQQTAEFVKKEMGGISYSRLLVNPRMQQLLQWAFLAPAWTIGRVWMGAQVVDPGPQGRQARKQAMRIALGYYVTANLANYAQTKKYLGKGRFLWDNPEDQKLNVFWKLTPQKQELYAQGSKASTEIIDDLIHPWKTGAGKLGAPIQAAVKIINWSRLPEGQTSIYAQSPLKAAEGMFLPSWSTGMSAYGTLPIRKGVTAGTIARYLDRYYQNGDKDALKSAITFGREAGIDVRSLNQAAKARWHHQLKKQKQAALLQ